MPARTNEDLVQETLIIIHEKYKSIQFEKGIIPWAYSILKQVAWGNYKTETRRTNLRTEHLDQIEKLFMPAEETDAPLLYHELVEAIQQALNSLPDKCKLIIKLKLEGFGNQEIIKKLKLSPNVFYVQVHRAKTKLKKILIKQEIYERLF